MMPLFIPPPSIILAKSGAAVSHTGNTNETVLATISIPANSMGLNGALRIKTYWTITANTNTKTARLRLGGIGGTVVGPGNAWNAAAVTVPHSETLVQNRNSASSQICRNITNRSSDLLMQLQANIAAAVDTTVAQDLVITGQLGVGTDTITLESYIVELL